MRAINTSPGTSGTPAAAVDKRIKTGDEFGEHHRRWSWADGPGAPRKTRLLPRMRVLRAVADAVGKAPAGMPSGGMLPKLRKGAPPDAWAQVGCVCRGRRFWREFYRRFRTTLPDRIGIRRLTRRRSRRRPRPSRSSRRSRTPMPQQMYPNAEAA